MQLSERAPRLDPSQGMLADQYFRTVATEAIGASAIAEPAVSSQLEWKTRSDDSGPQSSWGKVTWARWVG